MSVVGRLAEIRRSLPAAYWVVWLGTLINRAGGFVVPLLTFYLTQQRGLSAGAAGLIVSLYGAGNVVAALVGGVLADRLGRRTTMLCSLTAGGVLMATLGLVRGEVAIAVTTFALGFAGELYRPAVMAFVGDVVPAPQRLRAFGYLYWIINLSFAFAAIVGGFLSRWSYTALFIGDAATMFAYAAILAWRLPESRPPPTTATAARPAIRLGDVLRDRVFMTFWLLSLGLSLIFYQSTVPLSAHLAAQGYDQAAFGAILAVNGILIVVLQPAATAWAGRYARGHALAVAAVLSGVGFALHGAAPLIVVHGIAVAVWTLGEIIAAPINSTTVANLAVAEARGRYQGVYGMAWGLASMLGPLGGGALLEHAGAGVLWASCLGAALLLAVGYLATAGGRRARGA